MCEENRQYFFILLVGLLLAFAAGVLQAEETGPWYLISEAELQSIEAYRKESESEKQSWLLQANELKTLAVRLNERAANSLTVSETLNHQLLNQREENKKLILSFDELEADTSRTILRQNMQIGELKAENKALSGQRNTLLAILIGTAAVALIILSFKLIRFFKVLPV